MRDLEEPGRPPRGVREAGGLPARIGALARRNRVALAVLGCAAVFSLLLAEVLEGEIMAVDRAAYWLIVEHLRADWLTPVMEGFSALATPTVLIALLLMIAAFAPGRRPGWCCAVNLALAAGLNVLLKTLVQRPRPEGFRLVEETGFSFPSGHSMAAMAFFGLVIWLVWRYEPDRRRRNLLAGVFSLIILMIGVSRIYLGVHYASDVIGGFCASLIWLAFYTRIAVPLFLGPAPGRETVSAAPADGRRPETGPSR